MSNFDRDPVSVASRQVHGPSFGMGTLALVGVLGLGAGTILGGVIMPLLRSSPPDQSQTQKLEAAQATSRALLFSMYPQTIYASLQQGGALVSTGLSVEEYLAAVEVRSSQAGLMATKTVERKGDTVEVSYAFSEQGNDNTRTFPQTKVRLEHPKSLVLIFTSGPMPASIALEKARQDGRARSAGEVFVDMVSLGATPPILAEGQFLTTRGLFEIKLFGNGVGAFLDGVLVYPAPPPKLGPALALPGAAPPEAPPNVALPRRLALQSFQPAVGILKDRLILVASENATDECSAKAVILDAKRGIVLELPELLKSPSVAVSNARGALILNGFCVPADNRDPTVSPDSSSPPAQRPLPKDTLSIPKMEVRLSARYDLKSGALIWQRESVVIPLTVPLSAVDALSQTGPSTPWRNLSETRIASPVTSGSAMMSVACRPGGGVTLALSGLPVPADGQAAGVRFSGSGGNSVAQMRWRASAAGYELDGAARPNEARAILEQLRAGGIIRVDGAGGSKPLAAPGRVQIDRLVSQCGQSTGATSVVAGASKPGVAKPKPQPTPPRKTNAATQSVPLKSAPVKAATVKAALVKPEAKVAAPKLKTPTAPTPTRPIAAQPAPAPLPRPKPDLKPTVEPTEPLEQPTP